MGSKSAIITGASRGIGRAIARRLARDGFSVVVNYTGSVADAEGAVAEIQAATGQAIAAQADVTNATDVDRLFKQTLHTYGRIDVVVTNAGIMPLMPIASDDVEGFDKVIAVNLRGSFLVLGQAARHVSEGGRRLRRFGGYDPYLEALTVANDHDPHLTADRVGPQQTVHVVHGLYRAIVDGDDEVATVQTRASRRRSRFDAHDLDGPLARQPERSDQAAIDRARLPAEAQIGSDHAAARQQLRDHRGGCVDRDREADALRHGEDRRVDTDHPPARIDERAA